MNPRKLPLNMITNECKDNNIQRLISRPSLLQSALDDSYSRFDDGYIVHRKRPRRPRGQSSICTCHIGQTSAAQWMVGRNFQLFTNAVGTHSRSCPLFKGSWQNYMVGFKYVHSAALLALEASFTISRGAGGFSVSPFLQVRGLVRDNSPAFELVWTCLKNIWHSKDEKCEAHVTEGLQQLRSLFDLGEAAPGDIDPKGRNLLHVSHNIADRSNLTENSILDCS